jgi:S-(hydroxymethyl)glutathione dehydrogenase / alcohol dehydrogenase
MKTRAAVLYQQNTPLVIEELEVPPLKRGQVLVKILYTGICGAQYNEIIGLKGPDRFLPHMMGHEASAIVLDIGEGVTRVKKDDYVALSWIKSVGLDGINTQFKKGDQLVNAGGVTTFTEYSVVSENRVTKISRKISADVAAIIGCAILTGGGIVVNTMKAKAGQSIAVFGAGGIGSSVLLAAKRVGCSPIIAVDIAETKLAMARDLGATHTIDPRAGDVVARIREIVPEGLDFSVDASGAKTAMEAAFTVIKDKGLCVIAGNLSKVEKISFHPFDLIKGKRIVGTWGGESHPEKDIPAYVQAYLKGEYAIDRLITHRFKLAEINKAFEVFKSGEAGRIILEVHPED